MRVEFLKIKTTEEGIHSRKTFLVYFTDAHRNIFYCLYNKQKTLSDRVLNPYCYF